MAGEVKNFGSPDETRPFEGKGKADVVNVADNLIGRAVFEPGWKWSNNVKPIAQTDSCQAHHLGYCLSGAMTVHMEDGSPGPERMPLAGARSDRWRTARNRPDGHPTAAQLQRTGGAIA